MVNTRNILFICGGAFVGLDEVIERRIGERTLGFGADIPSRKDKKIGELLERIEPEDLLRAGLIPEFIGRLPVIATLHELNEEALVDILTKPKNALVKQYRAGKRGWSPRLGQQHRSAYVEPHPPGRFGYMGG